ncbi:unnamed protein product [Toxocara canis]|uniref:Tudor domain-containing protein n=1 Tax=Toxocara canis TaxID=6265 RepID=A0A183VD58_TOXCA|nr:unnamed protein product [Toxocara canis]
MVRNVMRNVKATEKPSRRERERSLSAENVCEKRARRNGHRNENHGDVVRREVICKFYRDGHCKHADQGVWYNCYLLRVTLNEIFTDGEGRHVGIMWENCEIVEESSEEKEQEDEAISIVVMLRRFLSWANNGVEEKRICYGFLADGCTHVKFTTDDIISLKYRENLQRPIGELSVLRGLRFKAILCCDGLDNEKSAYKRNVNEANHFASASTRSYTSKSSDLCA